MISCGVLFFYPTMVDALPAKGFGDGDDFY
jgi:hypothetical protein